MKEKVPCIIAGFEEQPRASPGQCSAFAGMVECRRTIVQPTVITAIITGKGHVQISKRIIVPVLAFQNFGVSRNLEIRKTREEPQTVSLTS